jgi:UPF0176 protein
MALYNRINKEVLKQLIQEETFERKTFSFYRYVIIGDPQAYRDRLFEEWDKLNCKGRIYIAREGINAQMSVPEHNIDSFQKLLNETVELNGLLKMMANRFLNSPLKLSPK